MKTQIKLDGYINFDIINDKRLQHSSIRIYFYLFHLYLKNGKDFVYDSLMGTIIDGIGITDKTLYNALKQLKKYEYIIIKKKDYREIIINGKKWDKKNGSFLAGRCKGSLPRDLRESFEPEKAIATANRENKS